jgi:hypothetical protein
MSTRKVKQVDIKNKCGHCIMLDTLYFGHLSCFTISNVKYAFQICKISEFGPLVKPFYLQTETILSTDR